MWLSTRRPSSSFSNTVNSGVSSVYFLASRSGPTCSSSPRPDASAPYGPRSLSHRYRRLAIKLGLRSTRLHSLRHYSATELVAAGVDVRTVAGRLGHGSGGATTLKVYAAWVDEADRRAATTMASLMPAPIAAASTPSSPYEVIAAELRDQIAAGQLPPGAQLPTIVELASRHSVAAGTAHRALDLLRRQGLVEVSRGKTARAIGPDVAAAPNPEDPS